MAQHFDIQKHLHTLRKQGAIVTETKSGYMIKHPTGTQVSVHHCHKGQNPHSFKRTLSKLKQAGFRL